MSSYTQLYYHIVFSVKDRQNLIDESWESRLHLYIKGIVEKKNQKLLIVNGISNHIHLLIRVRPNISLADLIRVIKTNTSKWINDNNLTMGRFEWQRGYGAFTVSQSGVVKVIAYIEKQKEHHKRKSFKEEYVEFLKFHKIEFDLHRLF